MKRVMAHIGFSSCITLVALNILGFAFAKYLCVALLVLYVASFIYPNHREVAALPVCIGAALFSCFLFMYCYATIVEPQLALSGVNAKAVFYLTGLYEQRGDYFVYTAKTQKIFIDGTPQVIRFKLYSDEQIPASAYQLIEGKLKFAPTGYSGFSSYGMWGKGMFVRAHIAYYDRSDEIVSPIMRKIVAMRYDILAALSGAVGGDEGSLAGALLVGGKKNISTEVTDAFKAAGASHLMAVSGLHLSVITGTIAFVLKKLRVNSRVSYIILIVTVAFYCMLADFSKSVVRAGIMMIVLFSGMLLKRRADTLNSLGTALFLICLNPFAVCDIGTLLSATCILAFVAFNQVKPDYYSSKLYRKLLYKCRKSTVAKRALAALNGFIVEPLIISVLIVLFTMPVMYLFFDSFSPVGAMLNVIIVPLGSAAVVLSMLTLISARLHILTGVFAIVTKWLLYIIISIVKWASGARFALVAFPLGVGVALATVFVLVGICVVLAPNAVKKIATGAVLLFFAAFICLSAYDRSCNHVFVSEGGAVALCSKGSVCVVNVDDYSDYYDIKSYLVRNGGEIDLLVSGKNEHSKRLRDELGCKSFVASARDVKLDGDLSVTANKGDFTANLGGVTVGSENADITVNNRTVTDKRGTISLKKGSVIYTVDSTDYFAYRNASELLT